jgi:hypothetical protein
MSDRKKEPVKEDFCGACLAIPLALVGAGASTVGAGEKGKHKTRRNVLLWGGISAIILSVLIGIYYLWIKNCSECG